METEKSLLIIPDSHAKPGVGNERFEWLGNFIVDKQPDIIANLGDMADMESLSSYDVGKKSFEGRRYKEDVLAVIDAQEKLFRPIREHNLRQRVLKKKQYTPRKVLTLGNHEHRISRAINDDPKLDGTLGISDLQYEEFGWEVHPFKEIVVVEGISFTHYFPNGLMDRAMSGNVAKNILAKYHRSAAQGHSHLLDVATANLADGKRIWSLVCGCYLEHTEEYVSKLVQQMWWRGVVLLHRVRDGDFDPEFISLDYIKRTYG